LDDPAAYSSMSHAINPYGDGKAGQRIVDVIVHGHCEEFAVRYAD
jgi:UDP-N-acetylglucosamine 2-epimerase (non-hydrolysing)